ncbi:MAG: YciI family protein [Calditrichia bacterium]
MKEFMLLIRADGNPVAELSPQKQQEHVEKVGGFIKRLVDEGKMIAAEPLEMSGTVVSRKKGMLTDGPFNETKEVVAGYYHIRAESLEEAVSIAKTDPRFEDGDWRIEVRPIMKVTGIN